MKFSALRMLAAATAALVLGMGATHAATQNPGTYDAVSVNTGSNDHALWLPNLVAGSAYWQFVDGTGVFVVTANGASLNATAVQNGNASNQVNISLEFDHVIPPVGYTPTKCGGGGCGDTSGWDFFRLAMPGSITGASASLAGLVLDITDKGPYAQLGLGANDKDGTEFGFSMWFGWAAGALNTYHFGNSNHGDVNLELLPSEIPLPAGVWLMLAGVGSLVGLRRKQRA